MSDLPEQRAATPEALIAQLVHLLDVEELDTNLYRGARQPGGVGRVFGGQVIAQALQAAQRSVTARIAHSLHAYFMRPGDESRPIIFRVIADFDGRSFATRRVVAMQRGLPILNMAASFHLPEQGLHHQTPMPDVPGPEELASEEELREAVRDRIPEDMRAFFLRPRPIEIRPVRPGSWYGGERSEPIQHVWLRAAGRLPDDPALHRAVLAYASDLALLGTSLLPHGLGWIGNRVRGASLDHAVWLHEAFRADEWLLYAMDSPWSGHARGFNRGSFYTRDGRLVASSSQEGLIRKLD